MEIATCKGIRMVDAIRLDIGFYYYIYFKVQCHIFENGQSLKC